MGLFALITFFPTSLFACFHESHYFLSRISNNNALRISQVRLTPSELFVFFFVFCLVGIRFQLCYISPFKFQFEFQIWGSFRKCTFSRTEKKVNDHSFNFKSTSRIFFNFIENFSSRKHLAVVRALEYDLSVYLREWILRYENTPQISCIGRMFCHFVTQTRVSSQKSGHCNCHLSRENPVEIICKWWTWMRSIKSRIFPSLNLTSNEKKRQQGVKYDFRLTNTTKIYERS